MFRRDGSWKEFGIKSEDTSIFPIWMFCISWAVMTYAFGRIFFKDDTAATTIITSPKSLSYATPNQSSGPASQPGYYQLNANVMRKKGIPRYIYVGTEVPDEIDETS